MPPPSRSRPAGDQITELTGHLNAGETRFLVLVEAFDREGDCISGEEMDTQLAVLELIQRE